jgi:hypothetical protein
MTTADGLPSIALSLRQPWATMVARGVEIDGRTVCKDIENRRWPTSVRGSFLIHAAKGMTRAEHREAVDWIATALGIASDALARILPGPRELPRGGIIGAARIVDVLPPCVHGCHARPAGFRCPSAPHRKWHMPDQHGFVLKDIRPLPFVACVGMLGFFSVPREVLDKLGMVADTQLQLGLRL